ncbi:MAG: hypothetical protein HY420_00360 [Candidatus Kerfeldbacteria bacterium]|nr:hypothetical protein [Candidatus Kerfeldbacteria bacterium]
MEHRRDIHGHIVYGQDDVRDGLNRLDYDLQKDEAEVFFKQAKLKGAAEFEDDHERQFTLVYDRGKGSYRVERRQSSGGGWI